MDDLSSRFLDAFTAIEKWLRKQVNSPQWSDFPELVDSVSESNYSVRRHNSFLKDVNKVRNLFVHNYSRSKPMAVPTSHAVEHIVAIRNELLSPPSLISLAASPVEQCRPTDPLGWSVKKMYDGVLSQLPIYDGEKCVGLLTAETIARWLANHLGDGLGLVEEKPIADVMQHQEDHENYTFMAKTATIADGFAAFDDFLHRGKRLEAILITHSGSASEKPLGIVTINDIPKLRRAIQE
jgi:predicted transcriptional regulator